MSAIKIGYINILETSTVTTTTEDSDYPEYRLCDRNIGRLYKGTSTADHTIKAQQVGGNQEVNALFIPSGHNLDGVDITVEYSTDDATWPDATTAWTQSGNGQILKEFTEQTKEYWRSVLSSLTSNPELPEYYLTNLYEFTCAPSYGLTFSDRHNVSRTESKPGVAHFLSNGEDRKVLSYTLKNISSAEKTEMESWCSSWGGYKPFLFVDHEDNAFFAELTRDIIFTQLFNRYTADISVMEVLA